MRQSWSPPDLDWQTNAPVTRNPSQAIVSLQCELNWSGGRGYNEMEKGKDMEIRLSKSISLVQAQNQLAEIVDRAAHHRERFILEQHGRPMAVLLGMEDYQQLQRPDQSSPGDLLPPGLLWRQEQLVTQAQQLQTRLGDPVDGLIELLSALPAGDGEFWLQVTETAY